METKDNSVIERLLKLKELYESGLISQEEMESAKNRILNHTEENDNVDPIQKEDEPCDAQEQESEKTETVIADIEESTSSQETPKEPVSDNISVDESITDNENIAKISKKRMKLFCLLMAALVVLVVLIIILSPTNYTKKLSKALDSYRVQGATVLSTSGDATSEDNHYIIFSKDDAVYIDELEKESSPKKLFPNETGYYFKTVYPYFEKGIPQLTIENVDDSKHTIDELFGNNDDSQFDFFFDFDKNDYINDYLDDQRAYYIKIYENDEERDGYLWQGTMYCCLSNPDILYFIDGTISITEDYLSAENNFTFDEVFYEYEYEDYPFMIKSRFSLNDMEFLGFDEQTRFEKQYYPMELIESNIDIESHSDYFYLPTSWFGTSKIDTFVRCIDLDVKQKNEKAEKLSILYSSISLDEIIDAYSENSVRAREKYVGKEFNLVVEAEHIGHSISWDYKYDIDATTGGFGLANRAVIRTNDEKFVEINYPTAICVKAKFDRRVGPNTWYDPMEYYFSNAKLLFTFDPKEFQDDNAK